MALLAAPSREAVAELFRDLHTLKGNSQAVGLDAMGALAHALEEVLEGLRARGQPADAEVGRLLLEANDEFRKLVDGTTRTLPEGLLDRVRSLPGGAAARDSGPARGPAGARPAAAERAPPQALTIPVDTERLTAVFAGAERLRASILAAGDPQLAAAAEEMTRMLLVIGRMPVARIVPRLRRVVIETAGSLGRRVELEVEGEESHADAAVVQDLGAVLPHLLRNAIDHGLEPPEERTRQGKPAAGRLRLAFGVAAEGLRVAVEDDGRGMDSERIVASAIARGIIDEVEAHRLSERERLRLIFAAGLSTRDASDAISGRGVGMDAVAAAVEKHRGAIEVSTEAGRGSRISLSFPLRLRWEEFVVAELDGWRLGVPVRQVASLHAEGLPDALAELPQLRLTEFSSPGARGVGPTLRLRFAGGEMILPVDALRGFAGALVQPAPPGALPRYVSGIAQTSDGATVWTLDAEELAHEL